MIVNESVYYLNAYEWTGNTGLETVRNADTIPRNRARRDIMRIARIPDDDFQGELPYRVTDEGIATGVYHIQQRANGDEYFVPSASCG